MRRSASGISVTERVSTFSRAGAVRVVAVTPDGRRAISANEEEAPVVWDLETGEAERALAGHTN